MKPARRRYCSWLIRIGRCHGSGRGGSTCSTCKRLGAPPEKGAEGRPEGREAPGGGPPEGEIAPGRSVQVEVAIAVADRDMIGIAPARIAQMAWLGIRPPVHVLVERSEERRVGKECRS